VFSLFVFLLLSPALARRRERRASALARRPRATAFTAARQRRSQYKNKYKKT